MVETIHTEEVILKKNKRMSPTSSSSLLERIPVSSYLSKRIITDVSQSRESRKPTPARPLSASSALAFISDYGYKHRGKMKDSPPKTLRVKEMKLPEADISQSKNDRGACLTNPNEPVHNQGFDNADGNLIVHESDVITPQSNCTYLVRQDATSQIGDYHSTTSFRIIHLLGQGTFAQVFKCEDIRTGSNFAIKIIKNKPAYTNQALMEIEIFEALNRLSMDTNLTMTGNHGGKKPPNDPFVHLLCYFMYRSHLCLVFELLGVNLYEILKRRQFRGLPLSIVRDFLRQALDGMNMMSMQNIIHCDLKPENILLVHEPAIESLNMVGTASSSSDDTTDTALRIKLIDFGSACFEGQLCHTYIQSRFYRSPEVILGLDYDSAIDMWSLGCVAAELLLGLPILPGLNEHDQLNRICEMIGNVPDWMIENGYVLV